MQHPRHESICLLSLKISNPAKEHGQHLLTQGRTAEPTPTFDQLLHSHSMQHNPKCLYMASTPRIGPDEASKIVRCEKGRPSRPEWKVWL